MKWRTLGNITPSLGPIPNSLFGTAKKTNKSIDQGYTYSLNQKKNTFEEISSRDLDPS